MKKEDNKLKLFKTEDIEIVVDSRTGETFASQSAVARMCKTPESTIRAFIKTSQLSVVKSAKVLTEQGLRTSQLLTEESILECIAKYNPRLILAFAKLGLRKFFHTEVGYNHKKTISLYPDRSLEYKELYNEILNLLRKTEAGKHHYIHFNQLLNRVVGKVNGRSNNTINEVENYAYCLLMKKTLETGNLFLSASTKYKTREAIEKQILAMEPNVKQLEKALNSFN